MFNGISPSYFILYTFAMSSIGNMSSLVTRGIIFSSTTFLLYLFNSHLVIWTCTDNGHFEEH